MVCLQEEDSSVSSAGDTSDCTGNGENLSVIIIIIIIILSSFW